MHGLFPHEQSQARYWIFETAGQDRNWVDSNQEVPIMQVQPRFS